MAFVSATSLLFLHNIFVSLGRVFNMAKNLLQIAFTFAQFPNSKSRFHNSNQDSKASHNAAPMERYVNCLEASETTVLFEALKAVVIVVVVVDVDVDVKLCFLLQFSSVAPYITWRKQMAIV